MKSAHAFAMLAFAGISAPALAQSDIYDSGTPVERFPGDPVQGGAMKEYQVPPEGATVPYGTVDRPRDYGYGSSYPRSTDQSFTRGADVNAGIQAPPVARTEPVVQSRDGVSWVCGGVGDEQQALMKSLASRYDMMLTFAAQNGAYLADVGVSIVGDKGRVLLQTECNGPLMLVDMPQGGQYRIRAQADGYEVARTVQVRENPQQFSPVVMTWPVPVVGIQRNFSSGDIGTTTESTGGR
jgi:hypothetical protein